MRVSRDKLTWRISPEVLEIQGIPGFVFFWRGHCH